MKRCHLSSPVPSAHDAFSATRCSQDLLWNMCFSFHRELKEKIQPEILELIKQQRLNRLVEGTCFRKLNCRRRQGIVCGHSRPSSGEQLPRESHGRGCWFKGRPCNVLLGTGVPVQVIRLPLHYPERESKSRITWRPMDLKSCLGHFVPQASRGSTTAHITENLACARLSLCFY